MITQEPISQPRGQASGGKSQRRILRLSAFGLLCAAFGLLLWARFLLVTGHPRTALAEPNDPAPAAVATVPTAGE